MATSISSNTVRAYAGSTGFGATPGAYNWSRLHAAAIDRSFVGRRSAAQLAGPSDQISKRLFDLTIASLLVFALSPLLLLIAYLAQRDGGPAFFGHRRIGVDGKTFVCWKFRTMVRDADQALERLLANDPRARAEWQRCQKLKLDPRITPIGRLLRETSLDELPQLFNVLTGEMSLVGPRPIVAAEVSRYGAAFHDYVRCRPGITGVWQVSGRNNVGYGTRVRIDQDYARSWSLWGDIRILLRTPSVVIRKIGVY